MVSQAKQVFEIILVACDGSPRVSEEETRTCRNIS
jgi:hypothetical protein